MNLRINCFYVRKCVLLNSLLYLYITRHLFGLIKCIHNNLFLSPHLLGLRIPSRYAFRMTNHLVIAKPCKRLWQSVFHFKTVFFALYIQNITKEDGFPRSLRSLGMTKNIAHLNRPVIASAVRCAAIRFSLKGIYGFFHAMRSE